MSSSAEKGAIVIASGKQDEFRGEPGSWTFRIRAEGTVKYRPSKATVLHARALHQGLVKRKREHGDQLAKLKEARNQALQQLDEGVGSEKVQALSSQLDDADEKLQAAQETAAHLQAAVIRAAADAKSAAELVKERDVRIVTYSQPITITVTPAPEKAKSVD